MTKIDIFSGFLGAGKTTLIKKLISEAFKGEKVVIIENEFGEIGIDSGFLKDVGIEITEMNSGCICCSLVGDFGEALKKVINEYAPDRIIIEPSGVGKLSDVIKAVKSLEIKDISLNSFTTVADACKIKVYMKNFGEFYNNQIEHANCIVLSRTANLSEEKLETAIKLIREHNKDAAIVTTEWDSLNADTLLEAMCNAHSLEDELKELEHHHHHHHHDEECDCHEHEHHHEHGEDCDCGCHEHEHEHHHHHHNEECDCHEHEHHHHHEHGPDCDCGCHEHEHEHHHEHGEDCDCGCHGHHADEVFTSWGVETVKKFTKDGISAVLSAFDEDSSLGSILRAKGIVADVNGEFIHFDYVPGEADVRSGSAAVIGRICVIGANLNQEKIKELFEV